MDRVTFLFDPRSPWCYQTSRWARRLEALGEVTLSWGVLSLEVLNLTADEDPAAYDAEYGPALRVAVALRASHGEQAVGDFYRELGALMWEGEVPDGTPPAPPMADLSAKALAAIGIDPAYADTVLADPATWTAVLDEHRGWIERVRAFGVPTLVFHPDTPDTPDTPDAADDTAATGAANGSAVTADANAADRAVFGPVLRAIPADDEGCLELWRHVRGIIGNGRVYELKKTKPLSLRADLPAAVWRANLRVADMRAARALMGAGAPHEHSSLEWTMAAVRAGRD